MLPSAHGPLDYGVEAHGVSTPNLGVEVTSRGRVTWKLTLTRTR
jgi:hypothetical protein